LTLKSFEIIPGDVNSSIILHIPHSSRLIPNQVREEILLSDADLEHELDEAVDTLTDELALRSLESFTGASPALFINRTSRFVIDPERFPDDREVMNKVGMGAVYLQTTSGAQLREESFDPTPLLDEFFHPYAAAFTQLVDSTLESTGKAVIIDVHSYRARQHVNAVNHGQKRPAMCVGTDAFHTPRWLADIFFEEFGEVGECFENEPYAGTYVPLKHYGSDARVVSVMMETRADTFLDENLRPHSGFDQVAAALTAVIERIEGTLRSY
jgi:N-formylglutamate amidohydrolase